MSESYFPQSYGEFKPLVAAIQSGESRAQFIGGGSESSVWRVGLEGLGYVIKFINPYSPRGRKRDIQRTADQKIQTGLRGLGIPGLEQFRTASPEDGVLVYRFVEGVTLSEANEADIAAVTPQHFARLRKTVLLASKAGIEIDGWNDHGGNAIFSPFDGITLIDYWAGENVTYEDNLKNTVRTLGRLGLSFGTTFSDESN